MIEWETGEITTESLEIISTEDPISCAIYAKQHNLLDTPGCNLFRYISKR